MPSSRTSKHPQFTPFEFACQVKYSQTSNYTCLFSVTCYLCFVRLCNTFNIIQKQVLGIVFPGGLVRKCLQWTENLPNGYFVYF